MIKILIFPLLFLWVQTAKAQPETGSMLIKNGTLITITNGVQAQTDLLIENGKIVRIGKGITVPKGIETIDATGLYVMPGIIDAHSHIGLSAINEATSPVTSEVFTGDALDPLDVSIYRALAGGVTISHALHGSANAIGGQSETIKHRWGVIEPDALKMEVAPRTIKFALGENPTRVYGRGYGMVPNTRMGVEAVFRNAFAEAVAYKKNWAAYDAQIKDKKQRKTAVPPAYSLRLQTLVDIMDGKILVHCHSYRADEILMLLGVLRDYGVKKVVFQHVNEGFKVAPELAEFGAMASVFADWWAYKFEVYYSTAYNAAILIRNNVVTSINSDSGELIRHLYHEAAKTQKYGDLTDEEALSLITINPAKQLGIDQYVGSLEEGKDGDIAIFKNHPLSVYAIPRKTIVDGVVRFDIEKDPDDVRLYVDPEEKFDQPVMRVSEEKCMQGADLMEFLQAEK